MTEARLNHVDRKSQRVRAVTPASPEAEAVAAALDVEPGWWRRHRARLGVIAGILGVVYAAGRVVAANDAETIEQAKLVTKIERIDARLSHIEGQLQILITRQPQPKETP